MSLLGYTSKEYRDEKGREYFFDNAKFILILLVVLAHAISPLKTDMPKVRTVWTVINAMHMPCFIMISGYLAKGYIKDGVVKTRRLVTYVVYYLAAQLTVALFEFYVLDYAQTMSRSVLAPRSSLWYLMCLIWWFAMLPFLYKLKPGFIIPMSILVSLAIGYDTQAGDFLSIARVINHFPFFIIGYHFKKEWLFKFRNIYTQIGAVLIIIAATLWTYQHVTEIPSRIITSNFNYYNSALTTFTDEKWMFMNRLIYIFAALVLCACFLLLVPRGKAVFTRFGSRTLQVYILHRYLYLADLEFMWYEPFMHTVSGVAQMSFIAVGLTLVLSLKIFEYPFKWLGKISLAPFENKKEEKVKA